MWYLQHGRWQKILFVYALQQEPACARAGGEEGGGGGGQQLRSSILVMICSTDAGRKNVEPKMNLSMATRTWLVGVHGSRRSDDGLRLRSWSCRHR